MRDIKKISELKGHDFGEQQGDDSGAYICSWLYMNKVHGDLWNLQNWSIKNNDDFTEAYKIPGPISGVECAMFVNWCNIL